MQPEILAHLTIASRVDAAGLASLAAMAELRRVDAGQIVSDRGQPAQSVFMIIDGLFVAALAALGGREVIIDTLGPGRIFGEWAALDGGSRVRCVRAECEGRLAAVSRADFDRWLADNPAAMRDLLTEMASQMRVFSDRIFELSLHDVETRVRHLLVRAYIDVGGLEQAGRLEPPPPPARIGALVGAGHAEVAAVLGRLVASGVLSRDGEALVLNDPVRLERGF